MYLEASSSEPSPSPDTEEAAAASKAPTTNAEYVKAAPQEETGSRRMMPMRALDALYRSHKFPNEPDSKEILDRFDAPTHIGYLYGQLVWGWFIAPLDGEYIFYTACDDACDLYMSPDEGKDHIRKIISQNRWSLHNQWDKYVFKLLLVFTSFVREKSQVCGLYTTVTIQSKVVWSLIFCAREIASLSLDCIVNAEHVRFCVHKSDTVYLLTE